jgi:hypothetical protein
MFSQRRPDEMPDFDLSQEEIKSLVAFAGIMAIGIHYGVDPNVPNDNLPKEIQESGGMLGLMMNTIRAAEKASDLLQDIVERAEKAESEKLNKAFEEIVNLDE